MRRSASAVAAGRSSGFTVVELVTVILLLGILSVVAFGRFVRPSAFTPGAVVHALILEARVVRQLAATRADAVVTFTIDRMGSNWRLQTATDVDGVLRTELVAADNTSLRATSGAADDQLDAATAATLVLDSSGDLAAVTIGGTPGDPTLGVEFAITGDSDREACIYPTGYANDAACL